MVTVAPQDIFKSKAKTSNCQSSKLEAGPRGGATRKVKRGQRPLQKRY